MISELFNDLAIVKDLNELLIYEKIIDYKKKHKIKLSKEEYFFDTYFLKPSFMLKFIERR